MTSIAASSPTYTPPVVPAVVSAIVAPTPINSNTVNTGITSDDSVSSVTDNSDDQQNAPYVAANPTPTNADVLSPAVYTSVATASASTIRGTSVNTTV